LYGGFMTTADGVRLIEYNARFGDPEAVNVLSILDLDLLEICWNAAIGDLASVAVRFAQKATVCKSVVPEGYPGSKRDGDEVGVDVPTNRLARLRPAAWCRVRASTSRITRRAYIIQPQTVLK
jgi:phosphoribosylamine-glycine ligase